MIDHIAIKVKNFEKSRRFYTIALGPLGYKPDYDDPEGKSAGFGAKGATDLWIAEGAPVTRAHIAFRTNERAAVDAFHAEALGVGGKDNGAPGPRTDYSPTYYAAFVLDPDGNNIEVVCHEAA